MMSNNRKVQYGQRMIVEFNSLVEVAWRTSVEG